MTTRAPRCHLGYTPLDYIAFYTSGLILRAEYEQYMRERFPGQPIYTDEEIATLRDSEIETMRQNGSMPDLKTA